MSDGDSNLNRPAGPLYSQREKFCLKQILEGERFEFEKHGKHCVGMRVLNEKSFGSAVLGFDLDATRNPWFVAPSLEASRITSTPIYDLDNPDLKLTATAQVGHLKKLLEQETPEKAAPAPEVKPAPEKVPAPSQEVPQAPSSFSEPDDPALVQIVKNVTQDGVKITKNTKGYNWEVSVHADSIFTAIDRALEANDRLQKKLGDKQ